MRALFLRAIVGTATLAASVAFPQMHKVAKPQQVVRAVGVYEWTGDFAKPTASRLIPVSVYIEGKFEDAGVYIARPIPLRPASRKPLHPAGRRRSTREPSTSAYANTPTKPVETNRRSRLTTTASLFDPAETPLSAKTTTALKPSKNLPVITASADPNRPTSAQSQPAIQHPPAEAIRAK
jgi:hypothetical protein